MAMKQTSPKAERYATQEDVLPLNETSLIGVFGHDDDLRALIRYPDGGIVELAPGDMTRLGRVSAIKPGAVYLTGRGRPRVLRMPGARETRQVLGV